MEIAHGPFRATPILPPLPPRQRSVLALIMALCARTAGWLREGTDLAEHTTGELPPRPVVARSLLNARARRGPAVVSDPPDERLPAGPVELRVPGHDLLEQVGGHLVRARSAGGGTPVASWAGTLNG